MTLVMTLLVRDEADILEDNLRYHFAQGVEFVVATDNGSTDGTLDVLQRYADAGLAHVIEERADEYHDMQAAWITRMARMAATDFGADWVINNDGDEFWWPVGGTLREAFSSIPDRFDAILAPRLEFVAPVGGEGTFARRMTVRDARSKTSPKLAHRAYPDVNVFIGSHRATRGGDAADPAAGRRRAPRPVLRGVASPVAAGDLLVPAARWPVRILHFPLRSYEQFEARVRRIAREEGVALKGRRRELEEHLAAGSLPRVYAEMVNQEAIEPGLRDGTLVTDTSFRDYLERCPDPGAAGPHEPIAVEIDPARRDAELADLEEDMMRTLARTEHTLLAQRARARRRFQKAKRSLRHARRREKELKRRSAALERRLSQTEASSGWRRVRDTAGRVLRGA
jgi:hypothetical protein